MGESVVPLFFVFDGKKLKFRDSKMKEESVVLIFIVLDIFSNNRLFEFSLDACGSWFWKKWYCMFRQFL